MKLQKLIYFAHGWALALANVPLIDKRPQAWSYGPVIPTVYHEFKEFGRNPITKRGTKMRAQPDQEFPAEWSNITKILNTNYETIEPRIEDDPDAEALLSRVWEVYGSFSAVQLSNMTHVAGSAWDEAYKQSDGKRGVEISDALIEAEFRGKIDGGGDRADPKAA